MEFWTNIRKKPQKGAILVLKVPEGTRTGVLPGSAMTLCSYQLSSHFGKISEKSNGWMKSYNGKIVIFGHFWHFGAFWPLLSS